MQHNILKDNNITKIWLIYSDKGFKYRKPVTLRFMDRNECYFASPETNNFEKPKRKTPAELKVFTPDGVYTAQIVLNGSQVSLNEVIFEVSVPQKYDFIQLRASTRKNIALPLIIKFNDGFEINTVTKDLSVGGVAFILDKPVSSIYTKISGILELRLPNDTLFNFPNGFLKVETKFVREIKDDSVEFGKKAYAFKFLKLTLEDEAILKEFLIKLLV